MTNSTVAIIVFVALGLSIAFAQKRKKQESPGMQSPLPQKGAVASDEEVKRLIESGQKIEAIKLYRQIHGVDLKAAKDAVDKMCN